MAILISDKVDFGAKKIKQRGTLHNNKRINTPGRHKDLKYIKISQKPSS